MVPSRSNATSFKSISFGYNARYDMSERMSTQIGKIMADKWDFDRNIYELINLSKTFCRFENCTYEQTVRNGTQPSVQWKCVVDCFCEVH